MSDQESAQPLLPFRIYMYATVVVLLGQRLGEC